MLEQFVIQFSNVFMGVLVLVAAAVVLAECSSDTFDHYDPYSGTQPGAEWYDEFNTLPPTFENE